MELNYIAALLGFLVYFPIFLLSLISERFKGKFMMIHAHTKKDYALEAIVGINYFVIIASLLITSFTASNVVLIIGTAIYSFSFFITLSGYFAFYRTQKNAMVRKWPFSFSRNPTYFYGLVALLGLSIITSSLITTILVLMQFVFTHQIVIKEEKYCEERYKQEYTSYKQKVPRYL